MSISMRFDLRGSGRTGGDDVGTILRAGQCIFGIAIAAFGVENFFCAHLGLTVRGVPWYPANSVLGYLAGIALLAAGLSIFANWRARTTAILLGIFFLLLVLIPETGRVISAPKDLGIRTVFFETMSMGAAALTLASTLRKRNSDERGENLLDKFLALGPYLFGISLVVFGSTHFLILGFIASLVPAWMHAGMFWAYFTGFALVAAGISIVTKWLDQLAATLIGMMFFLWFVLLHAPRVVNALRMHKPGAPDEWSSAFIAFGMCGGAWICGWYARQRRHQVKQ